MASHQIASVACSAPTVHKRTTLDCTTECARWVLTVLCMMIKATRALNQRRTTDLTYRPLRHMVQVIKTYQRVCLLSREMPCTKGHRLSFPRPPLYRASEMEPPEEGLLIPEACTAYNCTVSLHRLAVHKEVGENCKGSIPGL